MEGSRCSQSSGNNTPMGVHDKFFSRVEVGPCTFGCVTAEGPCIWTHLWIYTHLYIGGMMTGSSGGCCVGPCMHMSVKWQMEGCRRVCTGVWVSAWWQRSVCKRQTLMDSQGWLVKVMAVTTDKLRLCCKWVQSCWDPGRSWQTKGCLDQTGPVTWARPPHSVQSSS